MHEVYLWPRAGTGLLLGAKGDEAVVAFYDGGVDLQRGQCRNAHRPCDRGPAGGLVEQSDASPAGMRDAAHHSSIALNAGRRPHHQRQAIWV
jgi:hypothetical protein